MRKLPLSRHELTCSTEVKSTNKDIPLYLKNLTPNPETSVFRSTWQWMPAPGRTCLLSLVALKVEKSSEVSLMEATALIRKRWSATWKPLTWLWVSKRVQIATSQVRGTCVRLSTTRLERPPRCSAMCSSAAGRPTFFPAMLMRLTWNRQTQAWHKTKVQSTVPLSNGTTSRSCEALKTTETTKETKTKNGRTNEWMNNA